MVEVRAGENHEPVFATYAYDGTGRRISKVVERSGDFDTTEYFYYAGQQMIETREYLAGIDDYRCIAQFIFGTQYVDEPICMDANGDDETAGDLLDCDPDNDETGETSGYDKRYYYHQDANYNVVALTDSTGAVAQYYLYDAYGTLHTYTEDDGTASGEMLLPTLAVSDEVTTNNPFTYTGRFLDVETGLYYYRARRYEPGLGRFVQRDPQGQVIGVVRRYTNDRHRPLFTKRFKSTSQYKDGMALQQYVKANPIIATDPQGLCCLLAGGYIGGRYCGKGQCGDDMNDPPKDCVDAACRNHDYCYGDNGVGFIDPIWDEDHCKKNRCDALLCEQVRDGCDPPLDAGIYRPFLELWFGCAILPPSDEIDCDDWDDPRDPDPGWDPNLPPLE